jgi:hypothetical protein
MALLVVDAALQVVEAASTARDEVLRASAPGRRRPVQAHRPSRVAEWFVERSAGRGLAAEIIGYLNGIAATRTKD